MKLLQTKDSILTVGLDGNCPPRRRYLQYVMRVVGRRHELGQCRVAQNAIVRQRSISNVEDDFSVR